MGDMDYFPLILRQPDTSICSASSNLKPMVKLMAKIQVIIGLSQVRTELQYQTLGGLMLFSPTE